MGRGANSPGPQPLPKVSFLKLEDDFASYPSGVRDQQMRSFGYNDFSDFKRPEHYIRYIEPLESELAEHVEYDMDEQDQEWLDAINADRKKDGHGRVSYELFEIIMDRLEKEWFDLTKNIPKPDMALPSEDSTCAICDDSEGENTNAIVFCDGCNLAVHQDCYGVPYIPEGQWLCRKCTVSPENPVSCELCPNEGGAFKQTVHGDWVHLLCAIWVPETRVANDVFMEPITGIDRISKQRWRLKCSLCDVKEGACIQCNKPSCFIAFHVTCARKEKLLMPMKASQGSEAPMLAAFCEKHLPKEQQDARIAALDAEAERGELDNLDENPSPKSSKTARAYAKTYKPGPPLVPRIMVDRILQYISKVVVRHKREFVALVCKYWSLKREARRGAAFLKRLHLEPWTASTGSRQHTDEEKAIKLEFMKLLRRDLERVRALIEKCGKRESLKLESAETKQYVFDKLLLPHEPPLRHAFEKITTTDRMDTFRNPVSKAEVPDYYDVIERPMCWSVIDEKLNRHQYLDLQDFKDDVQLVATNAMLYNKPGTSFHKTAQRILGAAEPIMAELDRLIVHPPSRDPDAMDEDTTRDLDAMDEDEPPEPRPPVGDLEPPLDVIELLAQKDLIKDDIELELNKSPLEALVNYELPRFKPPPPAPPPKLVKIKINRKAMLERKRQERLDASPGFRARTRRASAMMAQFENETSGSTGEPEVDPPTEESEVPAPEHAEPGEPPQTPKRPGRKRGSTIPKVAPPMVEEVDNQQSFKMFDKGWILPPDQVRGGRQRPPPQPTPPKKFRGKGAGAKSHLAAFSTSKVENETLGTTEDTQMAVDETFSLHDDPAMEGHAERPFDEHTEPASPGEAHTELAPPGRRDTEALPEEDLQFVPENADQPFAACPDPEPPETDPGVVDDHGEWSVELPTDQARDEAAPHEDDLPVPFMRSNHQSPQPERALPVVDSLSIEQEVVTEVLDRPQSLPLEHQSLGHVSPEPEDVPAETGSTHEVSQEPVGPTDALMQDASANDAPVAEQSTTEAPADDEVMHDASVEEQSAMDVPAEGAIAEEPVNEALPVETVVGDTFQEVAEETVPSVETIVDVEPGHLDRLIEPPIGEAMEVDDTEPAEAPPAGPSKLAVEELVEEQEQPRRIVWIETLDTPAIRKEKNLRKRLERQRLVAEAAAAERAATAGPSRSAEAGAGSDLSDLSDLSDADEDHPGGHIDGLSRQSCAKRNGTKEPGAVVLPEGKLLEGGTLIWAKANPYPWWPAVVFEPDDPAIPKRIKDLLFRKGSGSKAPLHIVRFFDNRNSWQCLDLRRVRLLGEDDTLDQDMLANSSQMQRWKTPRLREQCREAFRRAMAERETEDEDFQEVQTTASPATAQDDVFPTEESHRDVDRSSPMTEVE